VRIALGLPLTLVLPGLTLLWAAVPSLNLSRVERVVAMVGISVACDICCGLLLGGTPIGLSTASVALTLGGATAATAVLAAFRTVRAGEVWVDGWQVRERGPSPSLGSAPSRYTSLLDPHQWQSWIAVLAGTSALLLAVAVVIASERSAASTHGPGYASVSALLVSTSRIRIGVTSHEPDTRTFRVSVEAGTVAVARRSLVRLRPGQSWTRVLSLPAAPLPTKIQADLFVGQSSTPYQRVFLFLR
jgi:hypothetical protein